MARKTMGGGITHLLLKKNTFPFTAHKQPVKHLKKYISSARQACIYLIQNTAKAVILWNIFAF